VVSKFQIYLASINPPEKGRFPGANGPPPVVSPDGRQIVFAAVSAEGKDQLWLRLLDALTAQPLAGTENASGPFWSPDSKSIGFFAGGKLKRMDIGGGAATPLADASDGRGGTWNQNGAIVFVPSAFGGLQAVPASGGAVHPVIPADPHNPRRFPSFLPDGKHLLYLAGTGTNAGERKIGIGSLDSPKDEKILSDGVDSFALYAQGRLLFLRGNTLVARPFDTKSLAFTGDAVPVAEQVLVGNSPNGSAKFSVSANGVLVYRSGLSDLRLTWLDRGGKRVGMLGDAGSLLGTVQFSPDRKTAAVSAVEASGGNIDIWLYDVLRGLRTRFTFDPSIDVFPVWSPDGRTIVFRSSRAGPGNLYRKPADGSRNEELLYADKLNKMPWSFSPDGKYLAYTVQDPKTGFDIWILPDPLGVPGASKPYPFVQTEFNEYDPQFSPDGHWIAYYSNESGRNEVYATPFPGPGGKRQVSTAGGTLARWRADSKELFYVSADSRLMAAEVEAKGGTFEVGNVDALSGPLSGLGAYDVSADGQRFLAILPPEGDSGEPLTVVQNWMAGLKK
jgi:Tol biopolymer transport system component